MTEPQTENDSTADALTSMLHSIGNQLISDPHGPQAQPLSDAGDSSHRWTADLVSAVPALGMIWIQGSDAASFLQGQLTSDIDKIPLNGCQWSGLCSPKGRLLATFLIVRPAQPGDGYCLLVQRDLAASISKRLAMYVLRAKVKVSDQSDAMLAVGIQGPSSAAVLDPLCKATPPAMMSEPILSPPSEAGARAQSETPPDLPPIRSQVLALTPIGVKNAELPRYLLLLTRSELAGIWTAISESLPVRPSSWWRAGEIISGIAQVVPAIQEAFVPQMINFELIGGVDFDKGCYTGQEVVARSQYLGKLKRRMFLATADSEPAPGADVTDANDKSVGTVVASAPSVAVSASGSAVVLFESRVDIDGDLTASSATLNSLKLPYEIPEPTPFVRPV